MTSQEDREAICTTEAGACASSGTYRCPPPFSRYQFVIDSVGNFTFHGRNGCPLFVTEYKSLALDDGGCATVSLLKLILQCIYPHLCLYRGSVANPDLTVHHINKNGNDHRVPNLQFKTRSDNSREGCREELKRKNAFRVAVSPNYPDSNSDEWQLILDTDALLVGWQASWPSVLRGELPFGTHETGDPNLNLYIHPDDVNRRRLAIQSFLVTHRPVLYSVPDRPEHSFYVSSSGWILRPNEGLRQYGCPMGRHTFELRSTIVGMDCARIVWDTFGSTPFQTGLHVGHNLLNGVVLIRCDGMRTVDKNAHHEVVPMTYRDFLQSDPKPQVRAVYNNAIESLYLATRRELARHTKRGQSAFEFLQMLNSVTPTSQGISDAYAIHLWQICHAKATPWGTEKQAEGLCGPPSKRKCLSGMVREGAD